jgi:hypothetical protein
LTIFDCGTFLASLTVELLEFSRTAFVMETIHRQRVSVRPSVALRVGGAGQEKSSVIARHPGAELLHVLLSPQTFPRRIH